MDEYIKFRLDPRLISELNIDACDLDKCITRKNINFHNGKIIMRNITITNIVEAGLRLICNPKTGIKKFIDSDAEIVFIKIDDYWYRTMLYSAGSSSTINSTVDYIAEFVILK